MMIMRTEPAICALSPSRSTFCAFGLRVWHQTCTAECAARCDAHRERVRAVLRKIAVQTRRADNERDRWRVAALAETRTPEAACYALVTGWKACIWEASR